MENLTIKDAILDKKIDSYHYAHDDYLAAGELTVTITLSEYRRLVEHDATAKYRIDEANKNKYERDSENDSLRKENAFLQTQLHELRMSLGGSGCEELRKSANDGCEEPREGW